MLWNPNYTRGKRCYWCPKNFQRCVKRNLFCRLVTAATFWKAWHRLRLCLTQCSTLENGSITWFYRRKERKPSGCSINEKEHKHQNQTLNPSSKLHSTWGNGPISLNLGVLVNKMGIKANVQGYCNDQFSSVTQSRLTLCDPMNRSTPGLPVHHQLPESTQTHVHWVGDATQPSHPLSSPSPPALNLSRHHKGVRGEGERRVHASWAQFWFGMMDKVLEMESSDAA